jgi:hypothetical protein
MTDEPHRDRLLTVGRYFNPSDAYAHRLALEEAGIDSCVLDETAGSMFGVGIGARLQVRAADEAAALAVLQAQPVPASAVPDDLREPPCPRCGSTEVSQTADIPAVPPPPVDEWPSRVWRYRCAPCQYSWPAEDSEDPTHVG